MSRRCRFLFAPPLNKHQHHCKQSSVGSVRLLGLAIVHIALGETRVKVTHVLLDVGELFVQVIEPKMRSGDGNKGEEKKKV